MKETVFALLTWIGSNTSLVYEGDHSPDVVRVPQETLNQVYYRGVVPQRAQGQDAGVMSFYKFDEGRIYLVDTVDPSTVEGKGALVHELVHFLQFRHGLEKKAKCIRQLERAAYEAQADFLMENGETPTFDKMQIILRSTCWML